MDNLLSITLDTAVPLWIERVRDRGRAAWETRLVEKSGEWALAIASRSDNLLYRGKKKGEAAELFNLLGEALAHLAFLPGGVRAFGSHWEARFEQA